RSGRGENSFGPIAGMVRSRTRYARTGREIFFTSFSPRSSNVQSSLSRTWSRTTRLIQIPPGSASASSRAATFTPSPKMSYSSTITSPRLIPIRKVMRPFSGVFALRSAIPRWTSAAHRTASTTLGNSARKPSPVFFTIRPRCSAILGLTSSWRCAFSARQAKKLHRLIHMAQKEMAHTQCPIDTGEVTVARTEEQCFFYVWDARLGLAEVHHNLAELAQRSHEISIERNGSLQFDL